MRVVITEDILLEYEGMSEDEALRYLNRRKKKYGKNLKRVVCQADGDKYVWVECTLKTKVKSHVRRRRENKEESK